MKAGFRRFIAQIMIGLIAPLAVVSIFYGVIVLATLAVAVPLASAAPASVASTDTYYLQAYTPDVSSFGQRHVSDEGGNNSPGSHSTAPTMIGRPASRTLKTTYCHQYGISDPAMIEASIRASLDPYSC